MTGSINVAQQKLQGTSDELKLASAFQSGMSQAKDIKNPVQTKEVSLAGGKVQKNALSSSQQLIIGFATMFIIFSVFGSTSAIHVEKVRGTWSRFKSSPASKFQILAGYGIGYFMVGWMQFLIMDIAGLVMFGHSLPISGWTILIISLYVLAIVGISLCISGIAKSAEQHMMIGSFTAIATSMLGGAYWPIDLEPTWMQKIGWFVPQSWAIDAFKATAIGLASMSSTLLPLCVLAGFAIVFFSAGMLQMKYS